MWTEYAVNSAKKNKASSLTIVVASMIASLFLSFLVSLSYNFWNYEVERILVEEGNWQGRLTGEISKKDIEKLKDFPNVETVTLKESQTKMEQATVDVTFSDPKNIYQELPHMVEQMGFEGVEITYHDFLLSRYLVYNPKDTTPPLLLPFYLVVIGMACVSVVLILRNSFGISMNTRIKQLGILTSIGATPKQLRGFLLQEAALLCGIPLLLGSGLGIGVSFVVVQATNILAGNLAGRVPATWNYSFPLFLITLLISFATVFFSAWLPAYKVSKLTPLEAIKSEESLSLKRRTFVPILTALFKMEGELAGTVLRAQRKTLRLSSISLTLSFFAFSMMLCFFTLSKISTRHTYFERYQDAWDLMITVKDTGLHEFTLADQVRNLEGVKDLIVYEKAKTESILQEGEVSGEVQQRGGLTKVAGSKVSLLESGWTYGVPTTLMILDNQSFTSYCEELGITANLEKSLVLNQIWDRDNSNFRYPLYIPYIKEETSQLILQGRSSNATLQLPIQAFVTTPPALKEEYEKGALVLFISPELWTKLKNELGKPRLTSKDEEAKSNQEMTEGLYLRILAKNRTNAMQLQALRQQVTELLGGDYDFEVVNRIQEQEDNDAMINGFEVLIGAFCVLLAIIGLSNVFSNTLGFLRHRKREFAQYRSMGLTPKGMKKIFCIEAFVIAGRPIIFTLPLTIFFVGFAIKASYLDPMEFIREAPIFPILLFVGLIGVTVALAYYLGAKQLMKEELGLALRNETIF